ncbi:MAG: AraC family transcriptional regulator [Anaerosolibacter sp.]|uniref:bifunctional transcriptional activator/DNA repair enzyme AdaA n=1 Tax=Anaerosolibacter sp. TaxID=1872527 RepID=UPI0026348A83|nr:Ada metal-binding domain-containing protein [Anaerosolibacter sp.]MDF2547666.1 AraC family transcriptional regulator [Anaerosolibacter sp.]
MQNEEKWNAVMNNNEHYDGLFFYAVKTTKIFCRPSCKAKVPLRKNTLFFSSADEALKEGFRPCKMCRPDINNPVFDPNKELTKKVKQELDNSYNKDFSVDDIAQKLGLSERHLMRLFKAYYGVTPKEYIRGKRISKSKILLKDTSKDIIDIAYEVGFKSISIFYKCFKKQTGITPKQYRTNRCIRQK